MIGVIIGFCAGIVSGMGIGGGVVLIPLLVLFLGVNQRDAQGINLFYFLPTALFALFVHIKNKNVDIRASCTLVSYSLIGALLGSYIAVNAPSYLLRRLFAILLFLMGIYEIFFKKNN